MKRGGSGNSAPPRTVHGRPDPPALDPRLSQADTVVVLTPDDPDPSGIAEQVQDSRWVASSFTDPPLPEDAPGSCRGSVTILWPVCILPSRHPAAAGPCAGFVARPACPGHEQ